MLQRSVVVFREMNLAIRTFTDRIAIVTGASSGIGRETALALAREGAHVALAARREAALAAVAQEIEALGREAIIVPTDVGCRDQVETLVACTLERWGRVDILVASAGDYVRASVDELTVEHVERSMRTNFYGALYAILAVLPAMRDQGSGHLVVVSSMDGRKAIPPDGPYVAAKFAVRGLAETLRQELRPLGIGVTTVFPGRVDTPMIANLEVPSVSAKIPPEAVARAIVRAIRRGHLEVVLPAQARTLDLINALSPRLGDWLVHTLALEGKEIS